MSAAVGAPFAHRPHGHTSDSKSSTQRTIAALTATAAPDEHGATS